MGCCFAKKSDLEGPLLNKGSIDYNEMDAEIQWDTMDATKKKHRRLPTPILDVQYVSTDDTENTSNRLTLSTKISYSQSKEQLDDEKGIHIGDWKPSILKTYKVDVTSIRDFMGKELLALLQMYADYFEDLKQNDKERLNTDKNGNYESYLALYNWFEVENKRGGDLVKLQRITAFCTGNNIWQLPVDIVNYLAEYYMKTNHLTQTEKDIESTLDERDRYYIKRIRDIIRINGEWLDNVHYIVHNDIILYYKIYDPPNVDLHSNRIPLILISEHGQCKEDWFTFPQLLSKHRQIITFDLRGIGQTGTNGDLQKEYTIDVLSSDIAALVETIYSNKRKICVLGNGYIGGVLAQSVCIRFEHLFDGLIICNSLIPCYKGTAFENVYINEYNHKFANNSTFKHSIYKKSKKTDMDDFVNIGCVESVTIVNDEAKDESRNGVFFSHKYEENNQYDIYSYIMETKLNDKECPFVFNVINGNIPSSILNRPNDGVLAQRNGYMKLISMNTNAVSSKIHGIKQPTLVFYGDKDHVIPCSFSRYLAKKYIETKFKEVKSISNAGHLWWLTHAVESADIINEFLFKVEEQLLLRYNIEIEDVQLESLSNDDEYALIIRSDSFISDKNDEYQQEYQLSVSSPCGCCQFLCRLEDLGRKPFRMEIKSKSKELIGYAQCILTEATDAALMMEVVDVNDVQNILMKVQVRHGVEAGATKTNDGNEDGPQRLDSADFYGLDL